MKKILLFATFILTLDAVIAQHPFLLKDINQTGTQNGPVGFTSSFDVTIPYSPRNYCTVLNGLVIFTANDGLNGNELWCSDGTTVGTFMLKDITAGAANTCIASWYNAGSILYFTVCSATNGDAIALWRTDGTVAGTFQLLDRNGHSFSTLITNQYVDLNSGTVSGNHLIGNNFYFIVTDTLAPISGVPNLHDRIYKTDGTIAGTSVYFDAGVSYRINGIPTVTTYGKIFQMGGSGNNLYITAYLNATEYDLKYNGTTNRTLLLRGDGSAQPFVIYTASRGGFATSATITFGSVADLNGNCFLFTGGVSDVASSGLFRLYPNETVPVKIANADLINTSFRVQARNFNPVIGNKHFFRGQTGKPTVTDGTAAGTIEMATNKTNFYFEGMYGNKVFIGTFDSVYTWDGVSATSFSSVSDSLSNTNNAYTPIVANNKLFFIPYFNPLGYIWTSDLDGSNCLGVYPNRSIVGTAYGNHFFGFFKAYDGGFDAGVEPSLFSTSFKIFTGTISNDWQNAGNWSPVGVPTAIDNVVIPSLATAKLPVISTNAACNNLTVCKSVLTINSGASLDINGYVANYLGSVTGAGTVNLKSTKAINLYGSSLNNQVFNVAAVNINGCDVNFTTIGATFNSTVNFQSDNKILAPYTGLTFTKKPFISGYNNNRFIVTTKPVIFNGFGSSSTADSVITFPVGTSVSDYTPLSLTYKSDNAFYISLSVIDSVNRTSSLTSGLITSKIVNKTWSLSNGTTLFSKVTLSWQPSKELVGFNRNACFIASVPGSNWTIGTTKAATLSNGLYSVDMAYSQLRGTSYIVASDATLLPLTLTYFTANQTGTSALLNWQTINEVNTSHFTVQRSTDGTNFIDIGKVTAKGDGSYSYVDNQLLNTATIYYRLQMVDKVGSTSYSKIIAVTVASKLQALKIFPNPIKEKLVAQVNSQFSEKATIEILDVQGKLLQQMVVQLQVGNNPVTINAEGLTKGSYLLRIKSSNLSLQQQFIKQ